MHDHVRARGEVALTVSVGEQTFTLQGVKDLIAAGVRMQQRDILKMGGITGLMRHAALRHAHGIELVPHRTQPAIGQARKMHLMATVMHLAKPVEVTDNPRRLNALFKNAPEPQNGAFPVPPGPGLDLEKLEPHSKPL